MKRSKRLLKILREMHEGTSRSNAEVLEQLGGLRVGDHDATWKAAHLMGLLLTREPYTFMEAQIGPSHLGNRVRRGEHPTRVLRAMASRGNRINRIVFDLYEQDFGRTRETLHRLDELSCDPRHHVPYFEILLQNAIANVLPEARLHGEGVARKTIERMVDDEGRLLAWVEDIVGRGLALKNVGGETHTILGVYDKFFRLMDLSVVPRDCDVNYDVGGGFAGPDLERMFGIPFVSLDVTPPSAAREFGVVLKRVRPHGNGRTERVALAAEDREEYLQRLDAQAYIDFDVFRDDFDPSYGRYLITSFGFLSSTVASLSKHQPALPRALRKTATTFLGMWRVAKLVAQGKDVSLLTIARPTARPRMNRAVFLRFCEHELVTHRILDEPHQGTFMRGVVPMDPKRNRTRKKLTKLIKELPED